LRDDLRHALGADELEIQVGAVCVYHAMVPTAVEALYGSGIPVAAVSTGFPAGLSPLEQRIEEIHASVAAGAKEIDIVITRAHVLTGNYEALYDEVRRFREACGDAHMKAILAAGEHGRDAGRRGLHQDVDRQGRRQRDAAVRRRDVPHDPRVLRADGLRGRV